MPLQRYDRDARGPARAQCRNAQRDDMGQRGGQQHAAAGQDDGKTHRLF